MSIKKIWVKLRHRTETKWKCEINLDENIHPAGYIFLIEYRGHFSEPLNTTSSTIFCVNKCRERVINLRPQQHLQGLWWVKGTYPNPVPLNNKIKHENIVYKDKIWRGDAINLWFWSAYIKVRIRIQVRDKLHLDPDSGPEGIKLN